MLFPKWLAMVGLKDFLFWLHAFQLVAFLFVCVKNPPLVRVPPCRGEAWALFYISFVLAGNGILLSWLALVAYPVT